LKDLDSMLRRSSKERLCLFTKRRKTIDIIIFIGEEDAV